MNNFALGEFQIHMVRLWFYVLIVCLSVCGYFPGMFCQGPIYTHTEKVTYVGGRAPLKKCLPSITTLQKNIGIFKRNQKITKTRL